MFCYVLMDVILQVLVINLCKKVQGFVTDGDPHVIAMVDLSISKIFTKAVHLPCSQLALGGQVYEKMLKKTFGPDQVSVGVVNNCKLSLKLCLPLLMQQPIRLEVKNNKNKQNMIIDYPTLMLVIKSLMTVVQREMLLFSILSLSLFYLLSLQSFPLLSISSPLSLTCLVYLSTSFSHHFSLISFISSLSSLSSLLSPPSLISLHLLYLSSLVSHTEKLKDIILYSTVVVCFMSLIFFLSQTLDQMIKW